MNSITDLNDTTTDDDYGWSFIICTDGIQTQFHHLIIQSITSQNIPKFEIIFVTENQYTPPPLNTSIITIVAPSDKSSHITFKKNIGARCARYKNLCFLHDYLILGENWYTNMSFKKEWNVCSFRILNLNGNRMSDWIVYNHPVLGHSLVDYNEPAGLYHYVPGLAFCVKKDFILQYPLNEELCWGQGEDIEWSERIKHVWNYKFNDQVFVQSLKLK